ncbi:hypothetical protein FRC02_012421 [Tulasnella sp. 418]|nr:hypothetical protein FRC02_012421 [Tulasnella sp. 418]
MESNYWASMAVLREKEGQSGYYHNGYWSVICHADERGRSCSHCGYVAYGMCSIGKMVHHLEAKHEIVPNFEQLDSISWNDGIAVAEMFDLTDEDDDSSEENGYYDRHDW